MRSFTGPKRPWFATGAVLALAGLSGCGNQYRPVVNPITPTGPAPQPQAFLVAFSQPSLIPLQSGAASPCPNTPSVDSNGNPVTPSPGIVTLIDFSGETVMAQATIGTGPLSFALDGTGSTAYSVNCDGTLSTVPISTTLQSKNVLTTTLPTQPDPNNPSATVNTIPSNILTTTAGQFVVEQNNQKAIGALTGSPPSLKQEIPVAPAVVSVTGTASSQRIYAISQGNRTDGSGVTWGQCDTPSSVASNGEVDGIEVSSLSVSSNITVGGCPVYGLMTPDGRRLFILNRGTGTISVIDSVKNGLDLNSPSQYMTNATINAGSPGKGPVHADYYVPSALLVTANYDDDSVTIIDTTINGPTQGYTDTANFGHVLAQVKLAAGAHPVAVTVLQDPSQGGTRAYVADAGDGTVTIINLTSFQIEGVLKVNGHPRSIASTFNDPIGKVYTVAQDSPYVTVIRTDTDIVSSNILLQGTGVEIHTTAQYAGQQSNVINQSRSVGSGTPGSGTP